MTPRCPRHLWLLMLPAQTLAEGAAPGLSGKHPGTRSGPPSPRGCPPSREGGFALSPGEVLAGPRFAHDLQS